MTFGKWKYEQCSDQELVTYARQGDLQAFDVLARRFRAGITLVAQQILGSRSLAEDVAQEVLVLAFKRLRQLKDTTKSAGWLYAITRHQALRIALKERTTQATEPTMLNALLTRDTNVGAEVSLKFIQTSEWNVLSEMVEQLPYDYRIVIQLRYWEEWPTARIAPFLSLPTTTVNWRLHQARKILRGRWEAYQTAIEETIR